MKIPLITIITPSYNQGRFIEETIQSIVSQEGDFFLEYMVMDGGSTDNTVEILNRYDWLIKDGRLPLKCRGINYTWLSEKDRGQTDAINKGLKAANGEFVGWLNSDDTYLPGAIKKAVGYFNEHEDVAMLYGDGYHIKENGEIIDRYYTEPFDRNKLAQLCYICQPAVFLRRKAVEAAGPLDVGLDYCMDYEYWMRIARDQKVGYLNEYLANSRLYAETKTMSKRVEIHEEILDISKKHYGMVHDSWLHGYADAYLRRWMNPDSSRLESFIFYKLRVLLFSIKSIKVNGRFPKVAWQYLCKSRF